MSKPFVIIAFMLSLYLPSVSYALKPSDHQVLKEGDLIVRVPPPCQGGQSKAGEIQLRNNWGWPEKSGGRVLWVDLTGDGLCEGVVVPMTEAGKELMKYYPRLIPSMGLLAINLGDGKFGILPIANDSYDAEYLLAVYYLKQGGAPYVVEYAIRAVLERKEHTIYRYQIPRDPTFDVWRPIGLDGQSQQERMQTKATILKFHYQRQVGYLNELRKAKRSDGSNIPTMIFDIEEEIETLRTWLELNAPGFLEAENR